MISPLPSQKLPFSQTVTSSPNLPGVEWNKKPPIPQRRTRKHQSPLQLPNQRRRNLPLLRRRSTILLLTLPIPCPSSSLLSTLILTHPSRIPLPP